MTEGDPVAAKKKKEIRRRRAKVLDMYNKGATETEMAEALGVDQSTINRDIRALSTRAVDELGELFDERLELECTRLISGIDGATKMMWELLGDKDLPARQRMSAQALLLKCYDARKEFMPEMLSAKVYAEQRDRLHGHMEKALDDVIKAREWDEPEPDEQAAPKPEMFRQIRVVRGVASSQ